MPGQRRVFIQAREVPGLLRGLWGAKGWAQRRILGARRGGRWGGVFAVTGAALAAPPRHWPALIAAHLLLSALGTPRARRRGLTLRPNQRLLLWWLGPALVLAGVARALGVVPPWASALAAVGLAHAGHARNLSRGLGDPEAERAADAPSRAPSSA